MYAEIKSENKILINRLNENERILLESIYNKSQIENSKITMERLLNDTADFGGVYLSLIEGGPEEIKLNEAIPSKIDLTIGEPAYIVFNTNVKNDNIRILTYTDGTDIEVKSTGNEIVIAPTVLQKINTNIIYYSIEADGFKSISDTVEINIVPKSKAVVSIKAKVTKDTEEYLDDVSITVRDINDTIIPITNDYYYLKPGEYSVEISHQNYITFYDTFTITSDDLLKQSIEKVFTNLEPKL